jgi:hypothetical protein
MLSMIGPNVSIYDVVGTPPASRSQTTPLSLSRALSGRMLRTQNSGMDYCAQDTSSFKAMRIILWNAARFSQNLETFYYRISWLSQYALPSHPACKAPIAEHVILHEMVHNHQPFYKPIMRNGFKPQATPELGEMVHNHQTFSRPIMRNGFKKQTAPELLHLT